MGLRLCVQLAFSKHCKDCPHVPRIELLLFELADKAIDHGGLQILLCSQVRVLHANVFCDTRGMESAMIIILGPCVD